MLYELRVYHMHPGRLPAIHKRFSEVTLDLFKDHGIELPFPQLDLHLRDNAQFQQFVAAMAQRSE